MRLRTRSTLAPLVATALLATALSALPAGPASAAGGPNLATGHTASASAANSGYPAARVNDGDPATYWEGPTGSFPQWVQVDLAAGTPIDQVVLRLPASWEARTQTLAVQGSPDGTSFTTIVGSAGYSFAPGTGNAVTINFAATTTRFVRVEISANTAWPSAQVGELEVYGVNTSASTNLARGAAMTTSGAVAPYAATNTVDGDAASYSESTNNSFPQWIQADLGSAVAINKLVLKLPSGWEARTQTLTVSGGTSASALSTVVASAAYSFTPGGGNAVTITLSSTTLRYLRLTFTANTAWPAGQLSELEVYGPATGDTQAPTAPTGLRYSQPATDQIRLDWSASTDNVGVTGYDVYANDTLRTSVAGTVLTFTDTQPASATVTYYVRARDAAGNQSGNSNSVTRTGSGGGTGGTNLAVGKPITASSTIYTFVAANANDNNVATYWEAAAGAYPNTLTVALGANADVSSLVLKLNPDSAWATRTQTIAVLGREQSATALTTLVAAANYTFNPASGNTVTIPLSARVADVQLRITANTGSSGGQIAEFGVIGTPAPNPDLVVSTMSFAPAAPVETDALTLSATVRNSGTAASAATAVTFYLGTTKVGTAAVGALAAGASATVSTGIAARDAGSYTLRSTVDEGQTVIETDETNNEYTHTTPLVVSAVASSDLVAAPVAWSPTNPAAGNTVTFTVAIKNQGTVASAAGSHAITLTVTDAAGTVVRQLTGAYTGTIAAGATAPAVTLGTWSAVNGRYTVTTVLAVDANEVATKQANNTSSQSFFVGRGANMPYDMYEAEDATVGGGATVIGPNRTVGDLAGEASGRRAVTLNTTGAYVEFTTRAATNTLVTRFSIPDSAGGGGRTSTLDVYVNGTFLKAMPLTSAYAWLYGDEIGPGNSPSAGGPRHIYDEANLLLGTTVAAGSKIRLQKDAANDTTYAIDFINTEQTAPVANPDPAKYTVPTGFTQNDVQAALDRVRMDTTGTLVGVYLPTGDYETGSKFQVYGKSVKVVGAGPWYTRFHAPSGQTNTDVGFRAEATAAGSTFTNFSYFGNYTSRIDGPGKVFDLSNVANIVIDNIWAEHMVCLYWGANTDHITIRNSRIRNTFADGINMTNGSTDNLVSNNDARATGDDSFALFSAIDNGGSDEKDNVYENLSTTLTWRAAGIAVYGGYANTFRNIYIADTLVYSGITISSLDFGYAMNGFGADPPTRLENISIVRAGGHFWGAQTFPGIWVFSASKVFQGIRVSDVDIVDPTYSGIMFQTNYSGGVAQNPVKDTVFTNITITGAKRSGDAYDAKSGFGIWVNEMPEAGQGPAVGTATFNNLRMSGNAQDIKNTTSTFTLVINP